MVGAVIAPHGLLESVFLGLGRLSVAAGLLASAILALPVHEISGCAFDEIGRYTRVCKADVKRAFHDNFSLFAGLPHFFEGLDRLVVVLSGDDEKDFVEIIFFHEGSKNAETAPAGLPGNVHLFYSLRIEWSTPLRIIYLADRLMAGRVYVQKQSNHANRAEGLA